MVLPHEIALDKKESFVGDILICSHKDVYYIMAVVGMVIVVLG